MCVLKKVIANKWQGETTVFVGDVRRLYVNKKKIQNIFEKKEKEVKK